MKKCKKALAIVLSLSMIVSGAALTNPISADAAKKKVKLSAKNLTVKAGQSTELKLKNNKKKVKWSVISGKKCVTLKAKKKTGVTVKGKKAGKAKVQAKVGKKKYTCTVTVKAKKDNQNNNENNNSNNSNNSNNNSENNGGNSQPTTTATPNGGSQPTGTPKPDGGSEPTAMPSTTTDPTATVKPDGSSEPTKTPTIDAIEKDGKLILHYAKYGEYIPRIHDEEEGWYGGYYEYQDEKTAEAFRQKIADSKLPVHVIVDDDVTYIPWDAFTSQEDGKCSMLKEIEIPASVEMIESTAFDDCNLTNIKVADDNPNYEDRDDGNTLIKKQYEIKAVLTEKAEEGTESETLKEQGVLKDMTGSALIKGNEKTKDISDIIYIACGAFSYCENLTSFEVLANVVYIDASDYVMPFSFCMNLKTLTVAKDNVWYYSPDKSNAIIKKIPDYNWNVIWNFDDEDDVLSDPLKYYGKETVLEFGCAGTVIPSEVTEIGEAFFGSGLTSLVIPANVTSTQTYAFKASHKLKEVIFAERTEPMRGIGMYAFLNCDALESIDLPDGMKYIGEGMFYNCSSLKHISIPDSVIEVTATITQDDSQGDAFYGCSSLNDIVWRNGAAEKKYTSIEDFMRDFTGPTEIEELHYNDDNASEIKAMISETKRYPSGGNRGGKRYKVIVDDGVTSIGNYAFSGCSSLTSIEIPNSVTSIGDSAFYGCSSLEAIEIPDSVTSIGIWAFALCSSLTSIEIPDSVTSIGESAFSGTPWLKENPLVIVNHVVIEGGECEGDVKIPDGVTSIGDSAFEDCYGLTSIEIPDSVTEIGDYAFYSCSSLTSIKIPDSVTSIGENAFEFCRSLTVIEIPDSVTEIGDYAFFGCDSLTSIVWNGTYNSADDFLEAFHTKYPEQE